MQKKDSSSVQKCPPLRSMGLPECFHNGIILIVICLKFKAKIGIICDRPSVYRIFLLNLLHNIIKKRKNEKNFRPGFGYKQYRLGAC